MAFAQNTINENHDDTRTVGSTSFYQKWITAWNLGNILEAPYTWTTTGVANPCEICRSIYATQLLIDSVKATGFHSVAFLWLGWRAFRLWVAE